MKIEILNNVNLAKYTSWLVGGLAEKFCLPKNQDEVIEAVDWAVSQKIPFTILGGGSNVLISDEGVSGLVICLKDFKAVQTQEEDGYFKIIATAGVGKSDLLKLYLKQKLAPALFLAGIPGDVGGGIVMNAGVGESFKPREFVEIVEWVDVYKYEFQQIRRYYHRDLKWNYRHCDGWQPGVILKACLKWPNEPDETILAQVRDANKVRLTKQPLDMPSCGSVFRNPDGHKAAQLIDQCGLKGYQVGDAQVSLKHANFIVNLGQAKATDIFKVIEHVRNEVKIKTGVELKTEVVKIGNWSI